MRHDVWARYAMAGPRIEQRRQSLRLEGYDYSLAGAYFITLCTQGRTCFFGSIEADEMRHNDAGLMICHWWEECAQKFPTIGLDECILMPSHFHGVVILDAMQEDRGAKTALGTVVEWFKTMTTNAYIRGVKQQGWPRFPAGAGSGTTTNTSSAGNAA